MFVLTMAAYNLTRMRTLGQIRLQGSEGRKRRQESFKPITKAQENTGISKYETEPQK